MLHGVGEQVLRRLAPAERPQRVDQPESADQERRHRHAEIVLGGIAHDVLLAHQFALHGGDRRDETRIVDFDDTEIGKQKHAGVEIVGAEGRGEGAAFRIPGLIEQFGMHRFGDGVPVFGARLEPEPQRDRREALAAGPAHRRRMSMDALTSAIFPDAGIGNESLGRGLFTERFEQPEQSFVAWARQAAVEEHRHRGENDAAIGVVLHLVDRGIADPHRAVAAIALQKSVAVRSSSGKFGTTLYRGLELLVAASTRSRA